jgi:hypothetical protein
MKSACLLPIRLLRTTFRLILCIALANTGTYLAAEQVRVVQRQGDLHGFLLLRDANGKEIAVGDQTYEVRGREISSRTFFRFRDGSVDDEEAVFRQGSTFQLVRDHHVQKGPSFPKPSDVSIDVQKGEVSWADPSKQSEQPKSEHMNLPPDLANGIIPLLVENFPRSAADMKVSYLAIDSKPRIVSLTIKPDGNDKMLIGVDGRRVDRFNIHTEIGGIAGVVAPLVGKQPPDIKLWIAGGTVPVFVRMDGPLYEEGPVWTVLLTAPSWPSEDAQGD